MKRTLILLSVRFAFGLVAANTGFAQDNHSAANAAPSAAVVLDNVATAAIAAPALHPPGKVNDVVYRQVDGESVRLDVSVPEGDGPFPVVILVHGGGWSSGDKQGDISPLFEPLTAAKFTWFSIDYRLSPAHRWPACYEDVQEAIRWVKMHAAEYKGDPARVAIIGYSAGGQLICQVVALAGDDTKVQAAVGIAPPTDLVSDTERRGGLSISLRNLFDRPEKMDDSSRALLGELSPLNHVTSKMPPFLLVHGTADKSVPYEQSIHFQEKLKQAGVLCELVTIKDAPHRLSEWVKFDANYRDRIVAWLKQTLNGTQVAAAPNP